MLPSPGQREANLARASHPPAASTPAGGQKSQRVLACIQCQRRKTKCDRNFPCSHCTKQQVQCVPATQTRRRRRRFPERELLDRLRKYEGLLRKNNVKFEPMHEEADTGKNANHEYGNDDSKKTDMMDTSPASTPPNDFDDPNDTSAGQVNSPLETPDTNDSEDEFGIRFSTSVLKRTWDLCFEDSDHILFGTRKYQVDLSTLHPEPVHIFRLWQLYLDNVNPLLRLTHTPSFQSRVIEAVSNLNHIDAALEALLFAIYCAAVVSIDPAECIAIFSMTKDDLLTKYRFGCQQALLNHNFLKSTTMDCITALFLYIVASCSLTDPRSVSSLLGIVVRLAKRISLHSEEANAKFPVLEGEMRRRLWWAIMVIDFRMDELADFAKTANLNPVWTCKPPRNINDSELSVGMKVQSAQISNTSEAIFAAVRAELHDFLRNSPVYLDKAEPALKPIARSLPDGGSIKALEQTLEERYLKFCDPRIPIHYMTLWMTRSQLAKWHLMDYCSKSSQGSTPHVPDGARDETMLHAIRNLSADTKLLTSPLTKRFTWLLNVHFPFPAYTYLIYELIKTPGTHLARTAWETMGDNFSARFNNSSDLRSNTNSMFRLFSETILDGWSTIDAKLRQIGQPLDIPDIVTRLQRHREETKDRYQSGPATSHPDLSLHLNAGAMPLTPSAGLELCPSDVSGAVGPSTFAADPALYGNMNADMFTNPVDMDFSSMEWWFK